MYVQLFGKIRPLVQMSKYGFGNLTLGNFSLSRTLSFLILAIKVLWLWERTSIEGLCSLPFKGCFLGHKWVHSKGDNLVLRICCMTNSLYVKHMVTQLQIQFISQHLSAVSKLAFPSSIAFPWYLTTSH